jgi:hypothetical protein
MVKGNKVRHQDELSMKCSGCIVGLDQRDAQAHEAGDETRGNDRALRMEAQVENLVIKLQRRILDCTRLSK